jgi:hypothetical protein
MNLATIKMIVTIDSDKVYFSTAGDPKLAQHFSGGNVKAGARSQLV